MTVTMNRIAILLCVFNSEDYLPELLDSLYAQTCQDFEIFVHDDGSSDRTPDILASYAQKHGRLTVLDDPHPGRKAKGSFVWLLEQVEADYYMFCDHDDVWLPFKVERTLAKMKECEAENPGKPVVVNTDLKVTDSHLKVLHPSFWTYSRIDCDLLRDFNYLAVYNAFTGCTMMIDRAARDLSLPVSPEATMHDKWIALKVAYAGGVLASLKEATILYRQHGTNEVGANKVDRKYYFKRILSLKKTFRLMTSSYRMDKTIDPSYHWGRFFRYKILYWKKRK